MQKFVLIVVAVAVLGIAGCGSDEDQEEAREATTAVTDTAGAQETLEEALETVESELDEALTRDLEEQNASGISGTVKLEPIAQEQIRVGKSYPAHIHAGTCADLNPTPEYPLEDVRSGRSETTIEASPLEVFMGEYAVNVHDADDPSVYVACANIPSTSG